MHALLQAAFVAVFLLTAVIGRVATTVYEWSLTPSGRRRKVENMPPIEVVNQELQATFGERECAWDADEDTTTPYTTELDRRAMRDRAEALGELDTHVHGDEFV